MQAYIQNLRSGARRSHGQGQAVGHFRDGTPDYFQYGFEEFLALADDNNALTPEQKAKPAIDRAIKAHVRPFRPPVIAMTLCGRRSLCE